MFNSRTFIPVYAGFRFRIIFRMLLYCYTRTSRMREDEFKQYNDVFESIIGKYDSLIERICFGYAGSLLELEDLKQEALLNIWISIPKYRGDCALKTWIYRITLNSCVTALRKSYRRIDTTQLNELYEAIDCDEENKKLLYELHEMISQLNPIDKSAIMLWLDNFSYEEIADVSGLSRSNVAIRIYRAKEKLKNLIDI